MKPSEFREFMKQKGQKNQNPYGIPQGSAISAVCSNVHLIDFDKQVLEWVRQKHPDALYRRYCDDLILIIPSEDASTELLSELKIELLSLVNSYENAGLKIQDQKTELRFYKNKTIYNENSKISSLDYLGFVLKDNKIQLREKSLFKYYSRAYKKVKTSNRIAYATKRPGPKRKLYDLYTHLGHHYKDFGNFNAYAKKAHLQMRKLPCKSHIRNQTKRHWKKIHSRLKP